MISDTPPRDDIPEPLPEIINQLEQHDLYVFPDRVYDTGIEGVLVDEQHKTHVGVSIAEHGRRVRVSVSGYDAYEPQQNTALHLVDAYRDAYPGDPDKVEITQVEHHIEGDGNWSRYTKETTNL